MGIITRFSDYKMPSDADKEDDTEDVTDASMNLVLEPEETEDDAVNVDTEVEQDLIEDTEEAAPVSNYFTEKVTDLIAAGYTDEQAKVIATNLANKQGIKIQ